MENEAIFKKLALIIKRQLKAGGRDVNKKVVVPEAKFIEDLGADSLNFIEIVVAAEEGFRVVISDEVMEKIKSVGDLVEVISSLKGNQPA